MFSSTLTNYLFNIFVSYPDYTSSLVRINKFLSLPQKNDNLTGLIITKKINSIVFENVYFKYSDKENKVLENYDKDFTKKNFSYLLGESKEKGTTFYFKHAKGES
jgi:ABC-type bacteriocin/lantibiotic exporter with double-glycine peptidase domain